jgi:hypothetical protein
MHCYQPDTASIVLNDHMREYASRVTPRTRQLEQVAISVTAAQGDKTQATKEVERINTVLAELRTRTRCSIRWRRGG